MHFTANGLVLRETAVGDSDKLLTVLFEHRGKLSVWAKGAKRLKSPLFASAQPFIYGNFTVFENKGRFMLDGGEVLASFYGLRKDITKLALGNYIAELCYLLTDENMPEDDILRLALNCLYAISEKDADANKTKAVFELRAMAECGFMPELSECIECGCENGAFLFDAEKGGTICDCSKDSCRVENVFLLSEALLSLLKYIVSCEPSKVLSFKTDEITLSIFEKLAERYLLCRIDTNPKTLEFYKGL